MDVWFWRGEGKTAQVARSPITRCSYSDGVELLCQACDVRRVIEPNGAFIERPELDEHFDGEISGSSATGAHVEHESKF